MATTTMGTEAYERLVLGETDRQWELVRGHLREKPAMTFGHNYAALDLGFLLRAALDRDRFLVSVNLARLKVGSSYFIPDVVVIPVEAAEAFRANRRMLEAYAGPMPLVVETWSPSTGDYVLTVEVAAYQARGDLEIWCLHPFYRTLPAWRRETDGTYTETVFRGSTVSPVAFPGLTVDLDALLD